MKYVGKNGLKVGDNEVWHEGNLEIGARNLLIQNNFKQNTALASDTGIPTTVNRANLSDKIFVYSNKEVTISRKGGTVNNINGNITFDYLKIGFFNANDESIKLIVYPNSVNKKPPVTHEIPVGTTYIMISSSREDLYNLKAEFGTIPTDWTPAPEDIQEQIDDKADKSQVKTDVPANAKFTDTTYTEISESEINTGTASTLRTITARRIKYILDKVQGWINALTKADVGLGNVTNDKQATKTEFDSHNSDTTKHITSTERTSWNGKWAYNENTIKAVKVNNAGNADTVNGKTVAENVPAGAKFTDTVYTHPTSAGNKHIPAGGASGQFLKWSANGTATWDSVPGGLSLGETSGTAYRGDRGKVAYDHSQNAAVHIKTVTSATEPSNLNAGDQWHKEI